MPDETSARNLRENLTATQNDAATYGHTSYVTNHGHRTAAIARASWPSKASGREVKALLGP